MALVIAQLGRLLRRTPPARRSVHVASSLF
jgi:hypothetical protein